MSLRKQSLIASTLSIIAMVVILYGALYLILMQSFLRLETENVEENLDRTINALSNTLNNMSSTAADWAYWDDTYTFVIGTNDAFVEGNVNYDTLQNLDLDFMLYLDRNGQFMQVYAIDLQTEENVPVSDWLMGYISGNALILDHTDLMKSFQGLIQSPDGPIMIASRAILTSQSQGPAAGTLVLGRYLNTSRLLALSESLGVSTDIYSIDDFPEMNFVEMENQSTSPIVVKARDSATIDGYMRLDDISNQPALVLHVTMARPIYTQAQTTLAYILLAFVAVTIAFVSSTFFQINRVMSRLSGLSKLMTHIRKTGDTSIDVSITGKDEVTNLAKGLREMLDALAHSRRELQHTNDSLEKLVEHRTIELVETNTQLKQEIAERKQVQSELAQARDQAIEALRLKTQILANISHDARTPLSVILLRIRMLQTGHYGEVSNTQMEKLESIVFQVHQLTRFINNLLDGAQMENAQIRLEYRDIAPKELLLHLDETLGPLAERKHLQLTWEVDGNLSDTIHIDPARFDQIISNLVGNAIKFTEKGRVHVRLFQLNADHWALEVGDTGLGIAPEAQEHIFDAFWQVDGSLTREANRGVGLGLAIVKQLTALMNGEITVKSHLGAGTTFTVIFPLNVTKRETA